MSRKIKWIVWHCTGADQRQSVESIQNYWQNTLKWSSPGYHYIIEADGNVVTLANENEITNGVTGHINKEAINICYIGGHKIDDRTVEQKEAQKRIYLAMKAKYPEAKHMGHRDFWFKFKIEKARKACPRFDVEKEIKKWEA